MGANSITQSLVDMDDNLYSQILRFYTSADKKYSQHIYDLDPEKLKNAKPFNVKHRTLLHDDKEALVKSRLPIILKACHESPVTGHFGSEKTFKKISLQYSWKAMKNDVHDCIKKYPKCFGVNPKLSQETPAFNPVSVPAKIWSMVGIYFIGPLHEITQCNTSTVHCRCH